MVLFGKSARIVSLAGIRQARRLSGYADHYLGSGAVVPFLANVAISSSV